MSTGFLLAEAQQPRLAPLISLGVMLSLVVFILVGLLVMLRKCYRIPPPDHALIRTGQGGPRATVMSGICVIPIIHRAALLSLAPLRVDLTGTRLDSDAARDRNLPCVFQIAVPNNYDLILAAAERLIDLAPEDIILLVTDVVYDEYERLLAHQNEDTSQDAPATRFLSAIEENLNRLGLTVVSSRQP